LQLKDHDLRQLNADRLRQLGQRQPGALVDLSVRLLEDLKEARERLNQNPDNSSRPPSSRAPWFREGSSSEPPASSASTDSADPDQPAEAPPVKHESSRKKPRGASARAPGKQPGAPGHGRTQVLPVSLTVSHFPEHCALCAAQLPKESGVCYNGYHEVDGEFGDPTHPVLSTVSTLHRLFEGACRCCGHVTRYEPYRAAPAQGDWAGVEITEWRLIGSGLASLLVWLRFRLNLSVRRCREFSAELLGLSLSEGAILQASHEAAHACEPIPQQIQEEILQAELLHADETSHPQGTECLGLWVVASATAALFFIGNRPKALLRGRVAAEFAGWLMSDGYRAYREYAHRLRC
jgi:transposase